MRIAVVALGKIGLPLAVQFADQGHEVVGADVNPARRRPGQRGRRAVPGRGRPAGQAQQSSCRPAGCAPPPTTRTPSPAPTPSSSWCRCSSTTRPGRPTSAGWMRRPAAIAEHLTPGTLVSYETTLPVGTTRTRWMPMLEEGSGLVEGTDFDLVFSPGAGADRPGLRRPAQVPEARRRLSDAGARRAVEFYEPVLDFDERPDLAAPERRLGPGHRRGGRDGEAGRDHLPRRQHRPGQPVRALRRQGRHRRLRRHRGLQLPAVQPHPPARHRRRRALHPGLPAAVPVERPRRRPSSAPPARLNAAMPGRIVEQAAGLLGDLARAHRGRARGRLPRRRQGDRVLRRVPHRRRPHRARAPPSSCTTRCTPTRSSAGSASPRTAWARPSTWRSCRPTTPSTATSPPADLPGIRVLVDGRNATSPEKWAGVPRLVIGAGGVS